MADKYALTNQIPNKVSELTNDSNFLSGNGNWFGGNVPGTPVWGHTTQNGGQIFITEVSGTTDSSANVAIDGKFYCDEAQLEVLSEITGILASNIRGQSIDLTHLDENKWYPCIMYLQHASAANRPHEIYFCNCLGNVSHPSWSSHSEGFTLLVGIRTNASGWGGLAEDPLYLAYEASYGGETAFGGFDQDGTASNFCVWLRGGAIYNYYTTNSGNPFTIYENGYTSPNSTGSNFSVETSQGNIWRSTSTILNNFPRAGRWGCILNGVSNAGGVGDYSNGDLTLASLREGMDMRFYTNNANIDFHVQNYVEGNVDSNRIAYFNRDDNGFYSNHAIHAEGGFFKDSDERLKSNIKELDCTLDDILSIPTVQFKMFNKEQIGTLAQSLEDKFGYLVKDCTMEASKVNNPKDFEHINDRGQDYIKVKKVEYEMLAVLALKGLKLLNDKVNKLYEEKHTQ